MNVVSDKIMLMKGLLKNTTSRYLIALIGVATLILGSTYTMVQQSTRLSADDAPLALAQNIKTQLDSGASPNDVVPSQNVNLRSNNNLFAIVTDSSRHVVASSATLDGQSPLPPKGVFDFTEIHNDDHFTWQPASGVRTATRVMTYGQSPNNGFVITGQSLKPFEDRDSFFLELAFATWLAILAWAFLTLVLPQRKLK